MEAIITYQDEILLEYNMNSKQFEISEDSGDSYPYEFYEIIELCDREFYLIYLEDISMVPTSDYDVWLPLEKAIPYLENEEKSSKEMLKVLKNLKIKDIL